MHDEVVAYTLKIRGGVERDRYGKRAGKGALIQYELSGTLGVSQDQTLFAIQNMDSTEAFGDKDMLLGNSSGDEISATLDAHYYVGQGMRAGEEREYIVEKRNQDFVIGAIDKRQDGEGADEPIAFNADVTTKVDMHGTAFSLRQKDYKDPQSIVFGISPYESNGMKSKNPHSGIYEAETSRTLDLNGGNPACNQGGMMVVDARGNGNGEIVPTLAVDHMNRVTDYTPITYQDKAGTLSPGAHPGSYNGQDAYNDMLVAAVDCWNGQDNGEINGTLQSRADRNLHANNTIRTESVVRRLTPLECERLQGFPDGWTDIGEWTDTNGKKHQPSDSPRYKALGNSIATPFWFYLLRRISAQYERPATLGSLFDGIGGFPYCWEMCNGKGTAVWASEIEEFPIAVTKRRFPEDGCAEEQVCCGDSQNVECGDEDEIAEAEE